LKISKEVKAGFLVVAAIALFVFGFNFLKGRDFFNNRRIFYAVYDHIDGLVSSNPVLVSGLSVGLVTKTELLPNMPGKILVTFNITNESLNIPYNTTARIVSADLMGSKAVDLVFSESTVYHQPGDTLLSAVQLSLTEEVNRQVMPLKNKAESLISSVDSVMTIVQSILNKETIGNLEKSIKSITLAISSLEKTAYRLDTLVGDEKNRITGIMRNLDLITSNFRENNQKITAVIANFESISDSLAKANIASTINNAEKTLSQTSEIMDKINKGEGSMGMLLNNDVLYKNLEKASLDLDLLLRDMRVNPQRYVHFSIIGRKNKPQTLD
jgi:phospholipid/cholesterol/gamma-HCH transport system substrate-binding protein